MSKYPQGYDYTFAAPLKYTSRTGQLFLRNMGCTTGGIHTRTILGYGSYREYSTIIITPSQLMHLAILPSYITITCSVTVYPTGKIILWK